MCVSFRSRRQETNPLPITLRKTWVFIVRPQRKSTRHLYSMPSSSKTGSILSRAGRTDTSKEALFPAKTSPLKWVAFANCSTRESTLYTGVRDVFPLYQSIRVMASSAVGRVTLHGSSARPPDIVLCSGYTEILKKIWFYSWPW